MILGVRKGYWLLLALALMVVGAIVFAQVSPLFAVKGLAVAGPHAESFTSVLRNRLLLEDNLFQLDKQRILGEAMRQDDIGNIAFHFSWSGVINAEVNRFEPVALIGDREMAGIDRRGRMIPFDVEWGQVDLPILTGLKTRKLFEPPRDFRVMEVIAGLDSTRARMPAFYRQIAEVDFSDPTYLTVYLTSNTSRFLAVSRGFAQQMVKLYAVSGREDWCDGMVYNLAFDDVVIKERIKDKDGTDTDSDGT
ncbi:MAG: hypothetical protein GYA46_12960 [candidate division Zixibacteria bacterium]|nr:hypothetical protein [candidate division Zixibacteria bacterium]